MTEFRVQLTALTPRCFNPYGDVIEAGASEQLAMNAGNFSRYSDLAGIDIDADGEVCISVAVCNRITPLPVTLDCVERHPLGSQAFIPLSTSPMVIVVAQAGTGVTPAALQAFISNGRQGINYRRGVWHMPMLALEEGQRFVIIDRKGPGANCDIHRFTQDTVIVHE